MSLAAIIILTVGAWFILCAWICACAVLRYGMPKDTANEISACFWVGGSILIMVSSWVSNLAGG